MALLNPWNYLAVVIIIGTSLVADCEESACNVGDLGSIPESGRSPGEENGYPLQYSCLQNPMGRDLVGYSSWGHKESDTTERLTHTLLPDGPVNKYGLIKVSIRTFAGNSRAKSFLLCDYQHSAMGTRRIHLGVPTL